MNLRDTQIVREMAKRQLEMAKSKENIKREKQWFNHNDLSDRVKPPIILENIMLFNEIAQPLICESEICREIENYFMGFKVNRELIDDDKVDPDFYELRMDIDVRLFDINIEMVSVKDSQGRDFGFKHNHPITNLEEQLYMLKPTKIFDNSKKTIDKANQISEIIGDIMPIKITNHLFDWYVAFSAIAVSLMGLEYLMIAMYDCPQAVHKMYDFMAEDTLNVLNNLEKNNLLTLNNGNQFIGSGSYGFTKKLPVSNLNNVTTNDLWLNMNSQESVGISTQMYGEFIFPYLKRISDRFGRVYYGCCEPVNGILKDYLLKLDNLCKVSVSAWANEAVVAEYLKNTDVIYSRKVSANFMGIDYGFDKQGLINYINTTIKNARDCKLEIIFRDDLTLHGNTKKLSEAVKTTREIVDSYWN